MRSRGVILEPCHEDGFDRLLLKGTQSVLQSLESMFELEVENSASLLEVVPWDENQAPLQFGDGPFYSVSCGFDGDLAGRAAFVLSEDDFRHLANELMPVLSLMFLSDPGAELTSLEERKPNWMEDTSSALDDEECRAQILDAFSELGNVLVGACTRAIFELTGLRTQHSLPVVEFSHDRSKVDGLLVEGLDSPPMLVVIDNELLIGGRTLRLWSFITLDAVSFERVLESLDSCTERDNFSNLVARSGPKATYADSLAV
ncbi:chemotaxis protein CheC [Elongatibacter sediminis]|uniref:CheC-like protein domain-containing protein n=1 Tax=Elongatibacter sediminis TaxID=3119006 RepID=A0AAW9REJ9_9GAMM